MALTDMAKCLSFTRTVNLPVLGLIENMSGFVCPCCGEVSNVFSTGGGEAMCKRDGLTFLGALPVDTELVSLLDASVEHEALAEGDAIPNGESPIQPSVPAPASLLDSYQKTASSKLMKPITQRIIEGLNG